MPPLSLMTEGVNLSDSTWVLREALEKAEQVAIGYGELIEGLIDFVIVAFTIFMVIKFMNRFKNKSEDPKNQDIATPKNIELLSSIEKLMEEQNAMLKKKND